MIIDYKRKLYKQDQLGDLYVVQFTPSQDGKKVTLQLEKNHVKADAIELPRETADEQWLNLWGRGYRHNLMLLNFNIPA